MAIDVKKLLSGALLELCNERPLAKVTVKDIIQKAGASRQTFYNHFKDKNDLITYTYCTHVIGDFRSADMKLGFYEFLCDAHKYCVKYKKFYTQACSLEGQNSLREYIFEQNYRNYLSLVIEGHGKNVITDELLWAIRFNAMGAINMHFKWVQDDMSIAPDVKAKYVLNCIPEILRQYLPA
ncbi:MAG: TetR family transcriptional regulator [Clostridiales Family XIII bacterium]|jgi:hypothetical protein|nr:TetR family transcriptional regulator [Clostridiales Family XIII bacterium]